MTEVKTKLREWNSPQLEKTFGALKFKKSTEQILKDSDEENWDE